MKLDFHSHILPGIDDGGLVSFWGTDMHNLHYVKVIGTWLAQGNPLAEY